ncbi:MAG: hypothetical protein Ct9H300mP18_07440 [Candidatus Neomarinimicrobiota bacterium]|nr:MAG: hypothetical protein Ct9H300mP18_07440 [Candidatus Neomarinimicrobiota bacterium]
MKGTIINSRIPYGWRKIICFWSEIGYDLSEKGNVKDNFFIKNFLLADYKSDAAGETENYNAYGIEGTLFDGINLSFDDGSQGSYDLIGLMA